MTYLPLKCPKCTSINNYQAGEFLTCSCGYKFKIEQGVVRFVQTDEFYEGRFELVRAQRLGFLKKLYSSLSISSSEYRTWMKAIKIIKSQKSNEAKLNILNLAAGGGEAFLNDLGIVCSVDLSFTSLVKARGVSDFCVQADAQHLPFPDNHFDLVFSSHFLGHLPLEIKDKCISEIYRVVKVGGFTLHSAETDADNFIFKLAKKYPELYQKNFIEMYGHHGLETFTKLIERFKKYSFQPVFEEPDYCVGIFRQANSYKVFFGDSEFRNKSLIFRVLYWMSENVCKLRLVELAANLLLRPFAIFNRLFGPDSVDSAKLMYVKK